MPHPPPKTYMKCAEIVSVPVLPLLSKTKPKGEIIGGGLGEFVGRMGLWNTVKSRVLAIGALWGVGLRELVGLFNLSSIHDFPQ